MDHNDIFFVWSQESCTIEQQIVFTHFKVRKEQKQDKKKSFK